MEPYCGGLIMQLLNFSLQNVKTYYSMTLVIGKLLVQCLITACGGIETELKLKEGKLWARQGEDGYSISSMYQCDAYQTQPCNLRAQALELL
eukprot:scaffold25576_cov15-Prasinocladus_malaysianus.AAC.1